MVVKMKQSGAIENAKLYFSGGPKLFFDRAVALCLSIDRRWRACETGRTWMPT
jgi:hypothetical protein